MLMMKKFHTWRHHGTQMLRAVRLVWAAAHRWTLVWGLLLVVQGVFPAVTLFLTRQLVDRFVVSLGGNGTWEHLQPALLVAGLMAGVMVLSEVCKSATEWVRTVQAQYVQDYLYALMHAQSTAVDLAFYETPEHFDRFHRAHKDTSQRPVLLLENLGSLLQDSITLLGMGILLLAYGPWLPLALLLSTLPGLYVVLRWNRQYHQWWERSTSDWRRLDYYDAILTQSDFATELRLFDLGAHFRAAYQALRQQLRSQGLGLTRQRVLAQLGAGVLGMLVFGSAMAWIGWRVWHGLGTLGDMALFYQAFDRGQALLRALLNNVGRIYSHSLFLDNLFDFLAVQPQVVDPPVPTAVPVPLQQGIRFQQVSFRYPGSEQQALHAFDLTIPAGQIVALVGANGAGKSTVGKLLCRLYDPEAGHITLDGLDLRDFSLQELRRHITVLFQKPVSYQATASANIAVGDMATEPTAQAIETAARGAGAHEFITRLPHEYETVLGKWFAGGTELSGGEWQRIALARAFLRRAAIVILDEPTSAMDSWAEAAWLARFRDLVHGQTAILITHRFTTAMQADMIHVMGNGRIVESGRHAELLAQGGLYAHSWHLQMRAAEQGEAETLTGMSDSHGALL